MNKKLLENLYRWQYPYIMLGSLALVFFRQSTNGIIMPLLLIIWLLYGLYAFPLSRKCTFRTIYTILIAYVFLSCVNYLGNGLPFKFFYSDFRGLIIPMLAVYIGMVNKDEKIYKWLVYSTIFCVVVGFYLYFAQPSWYLSYKVAALEDTFRYAGSNLSENNVMFLSTTGRFSSFFPTTYNVAYYITFSLCITLNDIYKDSQNRLFKSNIVLLTVLGILLAGIMLTLTRVAIVYIFILLFYYYVYGLIKKEGNLRFLRWTIVVVMGFLVIIFINISTHEYGSFVLERMQDRLSFSSTDDLSGGSRGSQIEVVMSACNDFVFGDGLGSRGGAARAAYLPGITDNDWIRILVELGGVGMILFIVVYGMTIYKAFKKKSFMMAELTIVLYGLLSMLVADTMYKGDLVLIFWFAIGRIWNQNLYLKRIKENNCI